MAELLTPGDNKIITSKKSSKGESGYTLYEIEINGALQKQVYESAYAKKAKDVDMKGFRKGEAPRTMVEPQIYSDLSKEVVNTLINNAVEELLADDKLMTIIMPEVTEINFSVIETPIKFTVKIQVLKDYKIPDLKKFAIKLDEVKASEEDVEKTLTNLWEDWTKRVKGEQKDKFKEISDEWVASIMNLPNVKTIEELKQVIRDELAHSKLHEEEDKKISETIQNIIGEMKVEVPEDFIKENVETSIKSQIERTTKYGMKWEDYLKHYKKTDEQVRQEIADNIRKQYSEEVFWAFFVRTRDIKIDPQNKEDAVFVNYAASNMGIKTNEQINQEGVTKIFRMATIYKALRQLRHELGLEEHNHDMGAHDHVHEHGEEEHTH